MTDRIFYESKLKVASVKKIDMPSIKEDADKALCIYLCSSDLAYKVVTKKEYSYIMREFYMKMTHYIMTTRFSNATFKENIAFREKNPEVGCIYGVPVGIRSSIPYERILFILEMNNDTNCIEGIGMVRNRVSSKKHYIYSNMNYNRFVYIGKHRIDKSEMTDKEKKVIKLLESFCFKGLLHMKRGHGITGYTTKILFHLHPIIDIIEFLREMFKEKINQKI
jgi:hypothetical protein